MKWLAAIALVFLCGAAIGQGIAALKLSVAAEKTQIFPGEPLVLKVVASNPGTQPVRAHRDLSPGYGMLAVSVESPGGKFRRVLGPGWGTTEAKPRAAELAPGASLSHEVTLFHQAALPGRTDLAPNRLVFDRPGRYRVQVTWNQLGFKESVSAPAIPIEVIAPQGANLRVSEALKTDPDFALFLAGAAPADSALLARVEKLVADHADSVFAKHFSLALGRHYLRAREPARAVAPLLAASSAPAKSSLRCAALLALADAYARTDALDKSRALLDSAAADFGESAQRAQFEQMQRELRKKAGGVPPKRP